MSGHFGTMSELVPMLEIERTDGCCSETESVTAQICSGRNRTEPHTQIRARLTPQTRDMRILKCCVRFSPRILTTDPHPHSPLRTQAPSRSRVFNPSEPGKLGHLRTINGASWGAWSWGDSNRTRPSALYYIICSLCSACQLAECRAWVNDPRQSAYANFPSEPSASVGGSQEFLRICVSAADRRAASRTPALQRTRRAADVTRNWSCRGRLVGVFQSANDRPDNYRRTALIVCPTAGTVLTAQRRMCATVGGALSETVATVSRTKRMLSMFRLRNKKCSETGPDRRCSGPEQYQKQFRFDL